ncbi:patatin-like phospholipase family protein [Caldimonas brevitalea]|uniref:NTE family protein n=1 Tax=Caldimonas brevitalea TaxID=413882 RepID=A0A0G3BEM7_9BURK|nr:patatin-like phospholipase family protein [Caldimonas brevitalea]AKJ27859.1 NTE family protein [Caldimonas brevitalea]
MKVIVLLQGGGSLGAFACGVWKALSSLLQQRQAVLQGVAGSSIGSINAAVIARHHHQPDLGAGALESLWRDRLATPSFPFLGPALDVGPWAAAVPSASLRSWNGVLTGLLIGNRGLYQSVPAHWLPYAAFYRAKMPLLDRSRMMDTLEQVLGSYGSAPGGGPLLGVAAVDVMDGMLRLFDSDQQPILPLHLAASSAIPVMFAPVEIDGRLYWDGDMTRASLVPLMLQRLRETGRWRDDDEETLVVSVEQMPRQSGAPPVAGLELATRMLELLQVDKFVGDRETGSLRHQVLRIRREPLPHDGVSGHFDYSPERVDELIAEGERQAWEAWQAHAASTAVHAEPAPPLPAASRARKTGSRAAPRAR